MSPRDTAQAIIALHLAVKAVVLLTGVLLFPHSMNLIHVKARMNTAMPRRRHSYDGERLPRLTNP
jgi:hypothetical protein